MFVRQKRSGDRTYLQLVENRWEGGRSKQRVLVTLGRLDELRAAGDLDRLAGACARFSETAILLSSVERGEVERVASRRIGPAMVFERLWEESGCRSVIEDLLRERAFEFPVERAIFMTVLHRLFAPGSDRSGDRWRQHQGIEGAEALDLHHAYRAMAWLGEELPEDQQSGRTPFAPRCTKDIIEERLFARRRDLFSGLDLVFMDTTSVYFEGEGGETLGEHGNSKDHRPDLPQMVLALVLDDHGFPVCCEMWPGNTTDVKTLIPVANRLQERFHIRRVCIVCDRGMISAGAIADIEARDWLYILGARMRAQREVRDDVVGHATRYRVVVPKGSDHGAPLKVREVMVEGRRYIVCLNEDQAKKDAADREAIVASLRKHLKRGDKSLVGNKGFRRYLHTEKSGFTIDEEKIAREARYDGLWVLRTNSDLDAAEVALKYKQLWLVEDMFRTAKSLLETRPIYHRLDETIRGHVFCSFLALVLRTLALRHFDAAGESFEWADVVRDLDAIEETEVVKDKKHFLLRSETTGVAGKVCRAIGVSLPPTIRQIAPEIPT